MLWYILIENNLLYLKFSSYRWYCFRAVSKAVPPGSVGGKPFPQLPAGREDNEVL